MNRGLAPALAAAGLVIFAPPGHADQWDFVGFLDSNGVSYSDTSDIIELGKAVCRTVRVGQNIAAVNDTIAGLTRAGFLSATERGLIIAGAAEHMCPDIWPTLNAFAAAPGGSPPPPGPPPHPCTSATPPPGCPDGSLQ